MVPANLNPIYTKARQFTAAKPGAKKDAKTRTKGILAEMLDPANAHTPEEVAILRQAAIHVNALLEEDIDKGFGTYIQAAIDDESSGVTYTRLGHAIFKFLLRERTAWRRRHEPA